jgi:iron complex transport system substrate-binding protein
MRNLAIVALLLGIMVACTETPVYEKVTGANQVVYAKHFRLFARNGYDELVILSPKSGKVETRYALVPRGTQPRVEKELVSIEVPVKNVAALSTTFIGMLNELNALDVVKASTDKQYVWNTKIKSGIEHGQILNVGYETILSPELLLRKKINTVLFSGFGQEFPNAKKLAQLHIVSMAIYDWEEPHALGKAEWIKVFGALTGKQDEARTYFHQITKEYLSLKSQLEQVKTKPISLVGSLTGDVWYAPAGQSYLAEILNDAGLDYVYKHKSGTASVSFTLEQISKDERKCAIWINAEASGLKDLKAKNAKFMYFQTYRTRQIYSYFHDSNYFWEMSAVHPEWLLSDFATIGGHLPMEKMHFYRKLK